VTFVKAKPRCARCIAAAWGRPLAAGYIEAVDGQVLNALDHVRGTLAKNVR
jgi:hypothetical protein